MLSPPIRLPHLFQGHREQCLRLTLRAYRTALPPNTQKHTRPPPSTNPTLQAEGQTYGWYYPAIKPFEHYVPIMKKHKDDLLDVSVRPLDV